MWIVMTSSAHMPSSCKGRYRKVALVQLNQHYTANNLRPKMISSHARGVLRVGQTGNYSVGKTARCAYQRALVAAEQRAIELNSMGEYVDNSALASWGGSA